MTWIKDTYVYLYGEKDLHAEGCCTGKYVSQGGIQGRTESTGLGVFHVLNTLLNQDTFAEKAGLSNGIKGKRIIVQGFGNVGYHFAHYSHKAGAKIVGIVERDGAIYNSAGLDPDNVKMFLAQGDRIVNYHSAEESAEQMNTNNIMFKECDVFAPCAGDGALNINNADQIKARVIIEGANGPTTFAADQIFDKKGIMVIPDMLANVGGVSVSYFEWLKNLDHVAPGRMTSKNQEQQKKKFIKMLGYKFPE